MDDIKMPKFNTSPYYCWRCENESPLLVEDPLIGHGDRIGVCVPCGRQRLGFRAAYAQLGTNLVVHEPKDGRGN